MKSFERILNELADASRQTNPTIFLDLDGTLADFEKKVEQISGRSLESFDDDQPTMWYLIQKYRNGDKGFFDSLEWMPDGEQLWNFCKPFSPIVLTGIPRGEWAPPQKEAWCAEFLGPDVPVITGLAAVKHRDAMQYLGRSDLNNCILVDNRGKTANAWTKYGGTFIHHKNAADSIARLTEIL